VGPIKSYARKSEDELEVIQQKMMELLDASKINHSDYDGYGRVVVIAPKHGWGPTDDRQKLLQKEILELYTPWIEHLRLLFSGASNEVSRQIKRTDSFMMSWIQKKGGYDVPASIPKAKSLLSKQTQRFDELPQMLESVKRASVIVVPDTNALAVCPDFQTYHKVAGQREFTLVLMPTVLSELDALKVDARKTQEFRGKVKSVIKRIKGLRKQGNLHQGVIINKTITVRMVAREPDFKNSLSWLDRENRDDRILASVLESQRQEPSTVVILSTGDINLQNKAEMAHIPFEEPPDPD